MKEKKSLILLNAILTSVFLLSTILAFNHMINGTFSIWPEYQLAITLAIVSLFLTAYFLVSILYYIIH